MKTIVPSTLLFAFPLLVSASVNPKITCSGTTGMNTMNQKLLSSPHATFAKQWVDYDVYQDGLKGMRIHVKFTAYDMKEMDSYVAIYFQDDMGNKLKDKNQKFFSTTGEVAVYKSLNPCCEVTDYDDLQLFMPYDELDLDPGKYNLTMDVDVIHKEGGLIQHLNFYDFDFTDPGSSSTTTRAPSMKNAKFENMWVDYDITENGEKGMRIHVKFTMANMKDVDSYLAIYFSKKNGDKLTNTNSSYSSKSGQLAVYKSLKPGYDDAVYNDTQIFMPYDQFNLETGRSDLTMDLDLIYPNGDLIKHLKYYDFWYENK